MHRRVTHSDSGLCSFWVGHCCAENMIWTVLGAMLRVSAVFLALAGGALVACLGLCVSGSSWMPDLLAKSDGFGKTWSIRRFYGCTASLEPGRFKTKSTDFNPSSTPPWHRIPSGHFLLTSSSTMKQAKNNHLHPPTPSLASYVAAGFGFALVATGAADSAQAGHRRSGLERHARGVWFSFFFVVAKLCGKQLDRWSLWTYPHLP